MIVKPLIYFFKYNLIFNNFSNFVIYTGLVVCVGGGTYAKTWPYKPPQCLSHIDGYYHELNSICSQPEN